MVGLVCGVKGIVVAVDHSEYVVEGVPGTGSGHAWILLGTPRKPTSAFVVGRHCRKGKCFKNTAYILHKPWSKLYI